MNANSSLLCVSLHEKLHTQIFFYRKFPCKLSFCTTFLCIQSSVDDFSEYSKACQSSTVIQTLVNWAWRRPKIGCKTETTLTTTAICNSLYWVFPSVESGRSNRPLLFGTKKIRWTKYRSSYKQKPFPGCRARPNKTMTMIILTRTVTTLRA